MQEHRNAGRTAHPACSGAGYGAQPRAGFPLPVSFMARQDKRPPGRTESSGRLSTRKRSHIQACLDEDVDRHADSLARHKLRYCALPEISLEEVSTRTTFAGQPIAAPLIISCMTGGPGREMQRITEPGEFHAWIGGSSAAELRTEFTLVAGPAAGSD